MLRDLFDLTGKVAIVTGGSRGLGLEMAAGLGEAGARVAVTARRAEWLTPAADGLAEAGIECLPIPADIAESGAAERIVQTVLDRFGRLDILVNNAGISWGAPAERMPVAKWDQVFAVNVSAAFRLCQAAFEPLRAAQPGVIVNVSSVAGAIGTRADLLDAVGYSASKGAVNALTRDLAVKWAPHGIRVNAIAPGFFPTRMSAAIIERHGDAIVARTPLGRLGREGDLKGVIVFLASPASAYVTGQILAVDGGMTAE